MVALGKCIWLCGACKGKFDAARHSYITQAFGAQALPFVRGRCDGCQNFHDNNVMFVHRAHCDGWKGL
jgi:hypothetical protein